MSASFNCLLINPALAFFGFGNNEKGETGLDLNRGYDINTVTSVSGMVVSSPQTVDDGQVIIGIKSGAGIINLSVGPREYWSKSGIQLHTNDTINAKGSSTQGKDGKTYLLVQRLDNRTNGANVVLRNDKGEPVWPESKIKSMKSESSQRGNGGMGGGMMRSGGGMMRSGGGMMRR